MPSQASAQRRQASAHSLQCFMCGACLKLFPIDYRARYAGLAATGLVAAMFVPALVTIALATLGAYVLFWVAFKVTWRPLRTLNAKDDISYGLYLYAWPVGNLLIWYWRDMNLVVHGLLTLAGSLALGYLSWHLLEKHFMSMKRYFERRNRAPVVAGAATAESGTPVA